MADTSNKRRRIRTFYSANQKLSLGAVDFSFNSKDSSVYARFAKQTAYTPDARGKGEYDWQNPINIKFDTNEVGGIIRALRTGEKFSFFHEFNNVSTSGSLEFYKTEKSAGVSFKVKKGDVQFTVVFPLSTGEFLMEYLRFALDHILSADYALEKAYFADLAKKKQNDSVTTQTQDANQAPDDALPVGVDDVPF